jgi:hypothetical protein
MQGVFRHIAIVVGVSAACWLVALMRWQMQSHDASEADFVKYLVLTPLFFIALVYAVRWAWHKQSLTAQSATSAVAGTTPLAGGKNELLGLDDAFRKARFQILGSSLFCGVADSASDLSQACADGKPLPKLDSALVSSDGLPIMAARSSVVEDEEWSDMLEQAVSDVEKSNQDAASNQPRIAVMRALSLVTAPLEALASCVELLPESSTARSVRVLLGVPFGWNEFEKATYVCLAQNCLKNSMAVNPLAAKFDITLVPGVSSDLWQKSDQVLVALKREKRSDLVALLACESLIDQESIDSLEGLGLLLHSDRRPWGVIPGEAAAMLLLANEEAIDLLSKDPEKPTQWLSRCSITRREKSIDTQGKVNNLALNEAVQALQNAFAVELKDVQLIVSDGDQHSSRATEMFGWAIERCPSLDPIEDIRVLGRVTGSMGFAGTLAAVAVAAQGLSERTTCALVLGQQDPMVRFAAFVSMTAIDLSPSEPIGR